MKIANDSELELQRDAARSILIDHIRCVLAAKGATLVSSERPEDAARKAADNITRQWSLERFRLFRSLVKNNEALRTKAELAQDVRCSRKAVEDFWAAMKSYEIKIRRNGSDTDERVRLFGKRRAAKFGGGGIALYLNHQLVPVGVARHIEETTAAAEEAFRSNREGALESIAGSAEASVPEKEEARRKLDRHDPAVVHGPQVGLFGT